MKNIFLFEWRSLLRNPLQLVLLLFFFAIGIYSVYYGKSVAVKQLAVVDSLQVEYADQLRMSMRKFKSDTTSKEGKRDYDNVTQPTSVSYLVKPLAIFQLNAFSILAVGQRDVFPFYKKISSEKSFTQAYEPEISNPEILAAGNFDLSFVLVNLIPLLIIILNFDLIAKEKQKGTFPLIWLHSGNPQRTIFYKFLFRAFLITLFVFMLNAVAIYICGKLTEVNLGDLLCWLGIVISYLLFWFSLCYLLVCFQKNAIETAFYMAGCWLLMTVILPSLINSYVDVRYPIGLRADMASEQRKIEEDVWAITPGKLISNFYNYHPEYKTGNLADTLQYSPRRFVAYYDELERRLAPKASGDSDISRQRNALRNNLSYFIPTMLAQKMLTQLANSDLDSFLQYNQSALRLQKQWQSFIYRFIFSDKLLAAEDYRSFPAQTKKDQHHSASIGKGCLFLLITALLLFSLTIYITKLFNKYLIIKK